MSSIGEALERSRVRLAHESEIRALRDRYSVLSRREREVMELVASGLLNKQVGGELGISEIAVKARRGQVMQKMKANSLADLVKMAGRLGLACVDNLTLVGCESGTPNSPKTLRRGNRGQHRNVCTAGMLNSS